MSSPPPLVPVRSAPSSRGVLVPARPGGGTAGHRAVLGPRPRLGMPARHGTGSWSGRAGTARPQPEARRARAGPARPGPMPTFSANARHLCIHGGDATDGWVSDEGLSRVRSLTVFGNAADAISYVRKCKLLRVLDLEECIDLEDDHLNLISELWHLRYLSFGSFIRDLPRSIKKLHCLETLDLRRTKIETLPIEAIALPHLAHLFGKFMLEKDDPGKLRKFLSGNKSKLQTLAEFVVNERQGFLQYIGQMKNLRKVKMWCEAAENGSSNYLTDLSQAIQEFTKVPTDRASARSLSIS